MQFAECLRPEDVAQRRTFLQLGVRHAGMRAHREVGIDGPVRTDHVPTMYGLKGLHDAVSNEMAEAGAAP